VNHATPDEVNIGPITQTQEHEHEHQESVQIIDTRISLCALEKAEAGEARCVFGDTVVTGKSCDQCCAESQAEEGGKGEGREQGLGDWALGHTTSSSTERLGLHSGLFCFAGKSLNVFEKISNSYREP